MLLVDGRNVQRSCWPNVPDTDLVAAVARWADREGFAAVAVFDGDVASGAVEDGGDMDVIATGRRSADDVLVELAGLHAGDGREVVAATSDRALRARLEQMGADVRWGGGRFVRLVMQ